MTMIVKKRESAPGTSFPARFGRRFSYPVVVRQCVLLTFAFIPSPHLQMSSSTSPTSSSAATALSPARPHSLSYPRPSSRSSMRAQSPAPPINPDDPGTA